MLITNLFIVRVEAVWTDPRQKISNTFSEKYEKISQMSENVNQKSDSFLKYAVGVTTTKISLWCFYFTHSSNFFSTFPSYYPLWLYTFLLLQISLKQSSQKKAVVLDWVTGFYCFEACKLIICYSRHVRRKWFFHFFHFFIIQLVRKLTTKC